MFARLAACALIVVAVANAAAIPDLPATFVGTCNINVFQLANGNFVCGPAVVQDYELFVTSTSYTYKVVNPVTTVINGQVATAVAGTQTFPIIGLNGDQLTLQNGLKTQCQNEVLNTVVPNGFNGVTGYGIQTLTETSTVQLGSVASGGGTYGATCPNMALSGPQCPVGGTTGTAQYQCTLQRKQTTTVAALGSISAGQPFTLNQLNGDYVGTCAVNVLADLLNPSQLICVDTPVNQQIYLTYANGLYTYTSGPQVITTINGKQYTTLQTQQQYKINSLNGNQLRLQGATREECFGEYLNTALPANCQFNPNSFDCLYPQRITEINVQSLADGSYGATCPTIAQIGCTATTATYPCTYVRAQTIIPTTGRGSGNGASSVAVSITSVFAVVFAVVALLF